MAMGPKPMDVRERFESKVRESSNGCWLWVGTMHPNGYGLFSAKVDDKWKKLWAHRVSFELYVRKLTAGETIDHLCRKTSCVNPAHLDPVTTGENSRRSPFTLQGANIRKTHCPNGHPYAGSNLFYDEGKRRCRECVRAKNRRADKRRRMERAKK